MAEAHDVVWILGAGFSAGLGGPLLKNLFTPGSKRQLTAYFPDIERLHDFAAETARNLYEFGKKQVLWSDPEEFLDKLDAAVESENANGASSASYTFMQSLVTDSRPDVQVALRHGSPIHRWEGRELTEEQYNIDANTVAAIARRLLAAECSAFLMDENCEGERWLPYTHWAQQLGRHHRETVITFNYDRVIEMLVEKLNCNSIHFVTPSGGFVRPPGVNVIKLHGSVDWKRTSKIEQVRDEFFALHAEDDSEIVIATPGPRKRKTVRELESLWTLAETELQRAKVIFFVGYRFPPTDSESLQRLMSAFGKNENKPTAHIVLGPNVHSEAASRLHGLLKHAAHESNPTIHRHPMYAQDFSAVYDTLQFYSMYGP